MAWQAQRGEVIENFELRIKNFELRIMNVEMWCLGAEIRIQDDDNGDGKEFVRICPNINKQDRTNDYNICLTREQLEEFIDALRFVGKRIK